jgi:hypothetical protein
MLDQQIQDRTHLIEKYELLIADYEELYRVVIEITHGWSICSLLSPRSP